MTSISPDQRVAVVTRSSSGIGFETSLAPARNGFYTYATVRKLESGPDQITDIAKKENLPLQALQLDVNDEKSVIEGINRISEEKERIDVVVNNAGYDLMGFLEETSMGEIKGQFETNFFGAVRVMQAVIPVMREQKSGKIVNIASMGGRIAVPFHSGYHGTKFALEGLSESIQYELSPFGIKFILIEPGAVGSSFWKNMKMAAKSSSLGNNSPYKQMANNMSEAQKQMAQNSMHPSEVVNVILQVVTSDNADIPIPKELENFAPIVGEKHTAVSTKGDLHFHIRGNSSSICYDLAHAVSDVLEPVAISIEEIHGFRYWDGRSIFGFVDGTENPRGQERAFFGLVGDDDLVYKGGSYLFVQKYIHDLNAFEELSTEEQEKVFGRYKLSDIEMPDNIKPSNSHIAVANIRDNMPFGNISTNEMGTYFIAYASTFSTVKKMLNNMFIGSPKGNYDKLLDFSTPKTGTLFFAPTLDMLDDFSSDIETSSFTR